MKSDRSQNTDAKGNATRSGGHKVVSTLYRVVRTAIVAVLITAVGIFATIYLLLSIPYVQNRIKATCEKELTEWLGAEIKIGQLDIVPFNEVVLTDISVADENGQDLLYVDKLGAGFSFYNLVRNRRIVFTYAEIIGLDAHITRPDPNSPTNLQFIIDAINSGNKDKKSSDFDAKIYNIVLRRSSVSYDVLSEPLLTDRFDPNHIAISNLRADLALPKLQNNNYVINLKRLGLEEKSGLSISNITAYAIITDTSISLNDLRIEMPNSHISINDIETNFASLSTFGDEIRSTPLTIQITDSYITPADLAGLYPKLSNYSDRIYTEIDISGTISSLSITQLCLMTEGQNGQSAIHIDLAGTVEGLDSIENLRYNLPHIDISANARQIASATSLSSTLSRQNNNTLTALGNVRATGAVSGTAHKTNFSGDIVTDLGQLSVDGAFSKMGRSYHYQGSLASDSLNISSISGNSALGLAAFNVNADATLSHKGEISGSVQGNMPYIDLNGYRYHNIQAQIATDNDITSGNISINDQSITLLIDGKMAKHEDGTIISLSAKADDINLANLKLTDRYPQHNLSFTLDAIVQSGETPNSTIGTIDLHDISFRDTSGVGVSMADLLITSTASDSITHTIQITSDVLNGAISGTFDAKYLIPTLRNMLAQSFPSVIEPIQIPNDNNRNFNNFRYSFALDIPQEVETFLKLPIGLLAPVTIVGMVDEETQSATIDIHAPYLNQKNKVIENSSLCAAINGKENNTELHIGSLIPMKKGVLNLNVDINGVADRIDTNVEWNVPREAEYSGQFNVSTLLTQIEQEDSQKLGAIIDINPTQIVFNDTAWQVHPAKIKVTGKTAEVDGLRATCSEQFIAINGRISEDDADQLCLELNDINLNYIFETLDIETAMFGGRATGKIFVSGIYSDLPNLATPSLKVESIEYNHAIMGNADIVSQWNNDKQEIEIDAVISQANGCTSYIDGGIFPLRDSLYFEFRPERVNAKFLGPYMSAFASEVEGRASGFACLYGTFSDIDLYGDIYADSLMVKLDFTNTSYYVYGDSVKMTPGLITFNDVSLYDRDMHRANLSGIITHDYFHNPTFNFTITDAQDFLCYNMPPGVPDQNWYGTVYGSGSVFVKGVPGLVTIDVNVRSAAGSTFTYELSDAEYAYEYDFITFTDRTPRTIQPDTIPERVRQVQLSNVKTNNDIETQYQINIQAEITEAAQINLVMDPVGGDKIRSRGTGSLRMTYNSTDELLTMLGTYTLAQGRYNFTLQDIIVREFTIQEGSTISFTGDPFAAQVDITAYYALNANLQDLDESFATDKDMNRTNVPVRALLIVSGVITEPEISFDLSFPTLTAEAYRKVRSVISTDDMMNRQIVYLLALNRFYTPDYMSSTSSSNNELASVASSTISSQLASALGQLSENWTIAPNFYSEKGDFSDVEVDLALSSQLLNRRLLINGNLGYRDNSLNSSSTNFVGDFDIEYLLTRAGTIRLKAYNHFNDQNYYIRSALTTQGVGVVFKHDFNRLFDFIKKDESKPSATPSSEQENLTGTP